MFPMLERGSVKLQKFGQTLALRYQRDQEHKRHRKMKEQTDDMMAVSSLVWNNQTQDWAAGVNVSTVNVSTAVLGLLDVNTLSTEVFQLDSAMDCF